jgi:hypothetical protein
MPGLRRIFIEDRRKANLGVLYTESEMQGVLRELRIRPVEGNLVNTKEAARILTWRAKEEQGVDHLYPDAAVRGHVQQGNLKVARQINPRFNLFRVEDIFNLPLAPKRGLGRKNLPEEAALPGARCFIA